MEHAKPTNCVPETLPNVDTSSQNLDTETEQRPLEERLEIFNGILSTITEIRANSNLVINLDLPDPVLNAKNFFCDQELLNSVHTPHRLYLDTEYNGGLYRQGLVSLSFAPRIFSAGKYSAHGVFFGDLQIETKDTEPLTLAVAVKPHEDEAGDANESCLQDYIKAMAVIKLGIHTLKPVGIINGNTQAYSLTVLQEGVTTLDSIDWSNFYPNIDKNPGMAQIWSQVARQAAMLHSTGNNLHGDLEARNIALDVYDTVFFIDWELANISVVNDCGPITKWVMSHSEIEKVIKTMCVPPDKKRGGGIGIFTGKEGDWWEAFKSIFFDEYAAYRMEFAKLSNTEARTAKELVELEESLLQIMQLYQYAID